MASDKLVDIVPIVGATGDFKKITDYDTFNNNNKISTLFNLLEYSSGKNSIFPNMGLYTVLNSIPYAESLTSIVAELSMQISKFLNFTVDVDYETDEKDQETVILKFTITGLPGVIKVNTKRAAGGIRLVNPRYIK